MTSATNVSSAVTSRYAVALIELAEEAGLLAKVEQDMKDMAAMMQASADMMEVVESPSLSKAQQQSALEAIAKKAKFQDLTAKFFGVLVQNRRLYALGPVISAFEAELAKRRGEVTVQVETAQDLTPAQLKSLQQVIAKGLGRDVAVQARVEPDILGGMVVTVGSHMIDDSVRRKLERLKTVMSRQSNENIEEKTKEVG